MKGFIINAGIRHLEKTYDELSIEELLSSLDPPPGGVYSPLGDYPDTTLRDMIEIASSLIGVPSSKVSKVIGVIVFSELLAMNILWVEQSKNTFEMLQNHDECLNTISEQAFPGFIAPSFKCHEVSPDRLEVDYQSTFLLADIAKGLIDAMVVYYKESIAIEAVKMDSPEGCNQQFILRRNIGKSQAVG